MGSGQTKLKARGLMDNLVGSQDANTGDDERDGVTRTTYSIKRVKTAEKVVQGVFDAAGKNDNYELTLDDAKEVLISMGISDHGQVLDELLSHVDDGHGKVKLKEFEVAVQQAAEIEEEAENLQQEVEQQVTLMKSMFDEMMEMLRWCDMWTDEQLQTFVAQLDKPKLDFLVDAHDECGNTMLIIATMGRQVEVIKLLLRHKANPDLRNVSGFCPLHYSCSFPNPYSDEALDANIEITKMLLAAGASPDLTEDTAGCTPLHYAASANNRRAVELLVEANAKVGIRCINGFRADEYARSAGFDELADTLAAVFAQNPGEDSEMAATIPKGWQEHLDSATGKYFYYNHTTGESSWTKPEEGSTIGTVEEEKEGEGKSSEEQEVQEAGAISKQPNVLNNPGEAQMEPANKDLQEVWSRSEFQEGCKRVVEKADSKVRETVLVNLERQSSSIEQKQQENFNKEREAMQRQIELMRVELEKAQEKAMQEEKLRKELENRAAEADKKFASEYEELRKTLNANSKTSAEDQEKQLAKLKEEFEATKRADMERIKAEYEAEKQRELKLVESKAQEALRKHEEELAGKKGLLKDMENQLLQEQEQRKKYYNEVEDLKGTIRVYARVRPISKSEVERGCAEVVDIAQSGTEISVTYTKEGGKGGGKEVKKEFGFDSCFGTASTQDAVFADTKRLMQSAIDGYNVCIFAYGQTGAGKTYTMSGVESADDPSGTHLGILPRAVNECYRLMDKLQNRFSFGVKIYMCELHMDNLVDLLSPIADTDNRPKLVVKKDRKGVVYVENITIRDVTSKEDLVNIIKEGQTHRKVTATAMNAESSRSHLVCSIVIESENKKSQIKSSGKLTLVDLAGSERSAKTGAKGDTLKEGTSINKSLTALGDVIGALSSGQKHVPYRNHILTQLMQDSLGGNAKTLMFVNVSPADYNAEETIASLNFAARCKTVTNTANKDLETKEIAALRRQIAELKKGKE